MMERRILEAVTRADMIAYAAPRWLALTVAVAGLFAARRLARADPAHGDRGKQHDEKRRRSP